VTSWRSPCGGMYGNTLARPALRRSDGSRFLLAYAYQRAGKRELAVKNYEAPLQFNQ
jgi:hypothetical protein